MDAGVNNGRGETATHARLKRLALLWAQAHGYSTCACEVSYDDGEREQRNVLFFPRESAEFCD